MATLEANIEFKQLCDVFENIIKAHKAEKKRQILQTFIDKCRSISDKLKNECPESDVSLYPILRLILPNLERERGPYNLKQASLTDVYADVFRFAKTSDTYKKLTNYREPTSGKFTGNDFADRAYQILDERFPRASTGFTIERINRFLDDISEKNATKQRKVETFRVLFRQITSFEMKWLTRIILKDLRLGIGKERILQIYHEDANEKFLVTNDLREICDQLHDPKTKVQCGIQIFSHFKPMLLEKCSIENIDKLFRGNDLYYAQIKYDGERSQLHMKDGKFKYFTRNGHDITTNPGYGETESSGLLTSVFARRLNPNCYSFILDGELMGWHKEKRMFGTKGMNFDVKKLSKNAHYQPCFVAFDVILHNDILLVDKPYKDRLKLLSDIFTEEEGSLIICPSTSISNKEELIKAFNDCIRDKEEGLVLKKYNVKYKPNVRNGSNCYKIKAEYSENLMQDLDLIILGGYYGEGKYTGMIKSFVMGVADPSYNNEGNPSRFLFVVSVSTGIKDQMLRDFQKQFAPHWIKECPNNIEGPKKSPPDVWIHPKHSMILTIRATEMICSSEYPTGYSLRSPRVVHIRTDKPWYSADTTHELSSLVKDKGMIQKLNKRKVTLDDINEAPVPKVQKTATRSKPVGCVYNTYNVYNKRIEPLTQLLDGKEICVVNGTDEFEKEQIEEILRQHSAYIVQNPRNTTFCVIVGNDKTMRGKEMVNSKKYDVVTVDWFKRITVQSDLSSLSDFLPWELLSNRDTTKNRLADNFDEYYDSFMIDADEESLKRSFDKIAKSFADNQFTVKQAKKIDEELFDGSASPYSLFRDVIGFFENPSCCAKFKFRFMSGTIRNSVDNSVTHVFVDDSEANITVRNLEAREQASLKIVKCKWIEECFRNRQVCEIADYLIDY